MSGTSSVRANVVTVAHGQSVAAVTADQVLLDFPLPVRGAIGGIQARAETAGSGTDSTVLDVLLNGTSIWQTSANRPTLAATSTGAFANTAPTTVGLQAGDHLSVQVASIPNVTGHARVSVSIAVEYGARGAQ